MTHLRHLYEHKVMTRRGKLLNVARKSQEAVNENNIRKRYADYQILPALRTRTIREGINGEHVVPKAAPTSITHIVTRA